MSNFDAPSDELSSKWSALQARWDDCRGEWHDQVASRFEREFWSEWQRLMPQAVEMMRDLEAVLDAAENNTHFE